MYIYLNVANNLVQVTNLMQFNFPSVCSVIVLRPFFYLKWIMYMYVCTYECVGILKHIQTEARKK